MLIRVLQDPKTHGTAVLPRSPSWHQGPIVAHILQTAGYGQVQERQLTKLGKTEKHKEVKWFPEILCS